MPDSESSLENALVESLSDLAGVLRRGEALGAHFKITSWPNSPRDWVENYADENGCYQHECVHCGEVFHGNKNRVGFCKECSTESV